MIGITTDRRAALLVPMHLDALVVNRQITSRDLYNRFHVDYDRMNRGMDPMIPPFESQNLDPPPMGVHLHWALPDGLTHGVENKRVENERGENGRGENERGKIEFPFAPNRWLVVRIQPSSNQAKPALVAAWVILSDALGNEHGSPFVDPDAARRGKVVPTRLGRRMTLLEWNGLNGEKGVTPTEPFLTAIGPGNMTFAAFAPGVENVFAFHDDLSDLKSQSARLTYLVVGWYSLPGMDPLPNPKRVWNDNGSGFSIADDLKWAVRLDGKPTPTRTLVHGMVYEIDWNPEDELIRPPTCPKDVDKQVFVAVGNTAIEALAALVSSQAENTSQGPVPTELLEAFQYNLISRLLEPGGKIEVEQEIRQECFGYAPGGTLWTVVAKERTDSQLDRNPPVLNRGQAEKLAQLNIEQRELDAQRRILVSMQWELYALWWKSKRINHVPEPRSKDRRKALENAKTLLPRQLQPSHPSFLRKLHKPSEQPQDLLENVSLMDKVIAQQKIVADKEESLKNSREDLEAVLNSDEFELKPTAMPRFWHPTDPVIVISGLGRSKKHGCDGTLLCRLSSETIDEINFPYQGKKVSLTTDDLANVIPKLSSPYLPAGTDQLLTEALFLDPGNAPVMAQAKAELRSSAATKEVSQAILDCKPDVPEGMNTIGRYGALAWRQPWVPLFLDWQVRFSYRKFDPQDFNGTGYTRRAGPTNMAPLSYSGRTFLTAQATVPLIDRLKHYLRSHPENDEARARLKRIEKWDILSQTISGFTSQLVMRDIQPSVLPDKTIKDQVEEQIGTVPFVNIVPDVDITPGSDPPYFYPLRDGFFTFQNLRIIDSFGRILNLMKANGNLSGKEQSFAPLRGRGMAPDGEDDNKHVILAPRVVQGSRLSFRFISAEDENQEMGLAADANPVCGWLLPNHLNKSIAVYDAGGNQLGELLLLEKNERNTKWHPAAGSTRQADQISNEHLRKMIEALISNDQGAAFFDLIDETLQKSDPLGERGDHNLAVLIGRPLALVRASLQLQLNGKPFANQAWHETFQMGSKNLKNNDGGLLDIEFPIRIGNPEHRSNGLIGYFQGTDYKRFHAVQSPKSLATTGPSYVQKIGEDKDYVHLKFQPTRVGPQEANGSVYLTMLIEPRGVVQAECGLLPAKTIQLPQAYFVEPLKRMAVIFDAGPMLRDSDAVCIPEPVEHAGTWSWIQDTGSGQWVHSPVVKADDRARFAGMLSVISEGWLKFVPDKGD